MYEGDPCWTDLPSNVSVIRQLCALYPQCSKHRGHAGAELSNKKALGSCTLRQARRDNPAEVKILALLYLASRGTIQCLSLVNEGSASKHVLFFVCGGPTCSKLQSARVQSGVSSLARARIVEARSSMQQESNV